MIDAAAQEAERAYEAEEARSAEMGAPNAKSVKFAGEEVESEADLGEEGVDYEVEGVDDNADGSQHFAAEGKPDHDQLKEDSTGGKAVGSRFDGQDGPRCRCVEIVHNCQGRYNDGSVADQYVERGSQAPRGFPNKSDLAPHSEEVIIVEQR